MRNSAGFTAIEVLVVVAMIGILGAIAAPSWLSFMTRQHLNTAREEVQLLLTQAQSDAQRKSIEHTITVESAPGASTLSISTPRGSVYKQLIGGGTNIIVEAEVDGATAPNISFDHKRQVVGPVPYIFKLSAVDSGVPQRCVVVTTLLGNMVTAQGDDCDADAWNSR